MIGGPPMVSMPAMPTYPPQGYAAQPQGYAAQPQGYAAQPQGYARQPQGYPSQPQAYAAQPQTAAPAWAPQQQTWRQPAPPMLPPANAFAAQTPAPKFRAQAEEEPAVPPQVLRMPTPTELGVPARAEVSWADAQPRLDRLGATTYHLDKLPQGGFRFTCLLPTSQADSTHRVQAEAASAGQAISAVLDSAEEWAHVAR